MKKPDRSGRFHLVVLGTDPSAEPVAVRRCPPFLPNDVVRLPGESTAQLVHRAKALAVGQGVAVTVLLYPGEVVH
jgi:hypothetical protein